MPDITMCKGTECLIKDKCYRHTAQPNEYRQSYFIEVPLVILDNDNQECHYFYSQGVTNETSSRTQE